jgi:Fe-S-cluster-containing dehydrogenase component
MAQYGLLIDNEYCTGCHSCEVACKNEKNLPLGQWGIKLLELGPWKLLDDKHWEYRYIPVPTQYCDLCKDRVADGGKPSCVLHCLASVMEYGPLEELAAKMAAKGRQASIFIP